MYATNRLGSVAGTVGVLFMIAGVVAALMTVMGFMNDRLPHEIASYGYGIGTVITIILFVIGGFILRRAH